MRCYTFNNMYLSSLQMGLQSAHSVAELFVRYQSAPSSTNGMLFDWAKNHKTLIVLNAGYQSTMKSLHDFCNDTKNPYPTATFNESEEAMGCMMTSISIVLPEKIYHTAARLRKCRGGWNDLSLTPWVFGEGVLIPHPTDTSISWELTPWDMDMVDKLITFRLAQ